MMPDQMKTVLLVTVVLFIVIVLWAISIGITYWDAASRRKLPGIEIAAWIALVVFIPGIGFAAYFFARLLGNSLSPNHQKVERPRRLTNLKRQLIPEQRTGTIPAAEFLQSTGSETFPAPLPSAGMRAKNRQYIIHILAGPNNGEEYILENFPVRIGRGFDVFISLDDDHGVSRQHAEIYQQTGVLRIRDLNSTHGTKVNDFSITDKGLDPGDQIQVGVSILKVGVLEQPV